MRYYFKDIIFQIDDKIYKASGNLEIVEDYNYGADADGHRGTYEEFFDNLILEEVKEIKNNEERYLEEYEITDDMYEEIYFLFESGKIIYNISEEENE